MIGEAPEPTRHPGVAVFGSVPHATPWLTEHNLAAALGRITPVTWFDPPHSPLTRLRGGSRRPGPARAAAPSGVTIARPLVLPPIESPLAQRLSRPLMRAQARRGGARPPAAIAVLARGPHSNVRAVGAQVGVYLVKDWLPAGASLLGRPAAEVEREVFSLCRAADLVLAVTERLRRTLREHGIDSELLRHGFARETATLYETAAEPADLAALPRPVAGYAGRIDERLDFDALCAVADAVPSGTVAMVGPVSPRLTPASRAKLRSRPNVRLLGSRDRRSLPGYLMGFDCCLLPYRSGPWGEHGSPLKLWDYLYAGAPLVASGYAILRDLPDFVTYVTAPEAFARAVSAALAAGPRGADAVRRRRAYALANTWDHRAAQLLRLAERVRGEGR